MLTQTKTKTDMIEVLKECAVRNIRIREILTVYKKGGSQAEEFFILLQNIIEYLVVENEMLKEFLLQQKEKSVYNDSFKR